MTELQVLFEKLNCPHEITAKIEKYIYDLKVRDRKLKIKEKFNSLELRKCLRGCERKLYYVEWVGDLCTTCVENEQSQLRLLEVNQYNCDWCGAFTKLYLIHKRNYLYYCKKCCYRVIDEKIPKVP